jgi:general secretion pathway protein D
LRTVALLAMVAFCAVEGAWAQEGDAPSVQFNFEQADVRLVTKLVGQLTGRTFIVPDGVEGKLTILTRGPVAADEVWPLFTGALEAAGYAVREEGGAWRVVQLPGAAPAVPAGAGADAAGGGLVTEIIRLQHVGAADVKRVFEGMVRGGKEGALEAFVPGNHLIVTATAAEIARLKALAEQLDQPGAGSSVEVVELQNASAEDVAEQLRATFGASDSAASRVQKHMAQVTAGAGAGPAEFSVVAVPQANSLVLVGLPVQIADMKRILEKMDVENADGFGRLRAIFLKYLSAEEAAKSLNALLGKSEENEPGRRKIAIEPSVANNALLVDARGKDFDYVKRLVEQLDQVPQQVLVEVLIAEVDLEKGLDLGVEWFGIEQPDGSGTGGFGRTRYGETDSMMSLLGEGKFPQGLAAGVLSGTFTAPDGTVYNQMPFYLRAVAGDQDIKILSNIPLWAQNNLEASVSVGENIPILKSSVEGSGSDRDYIQNIERRDVGITLTLTPHVNPNNEIQLDLNPCIETVVASGTDAAANYTPTISKREVKTTITVPDRKTVVISGLIREDTAKIQAKVPFLGDIPLLGWLFRSSSDVRKRTNLLIFVTPRIVTDPAQAEAERARLENTATLRNAVEDIGEASPEAVIADIEARQKAVRRKAAAERKAQRAAP